MFLPIAWLAKGSLLTSDCIIFLPSSVNLSVALIRKPSLIASIITLESLFLAKLSAAIYSWARALNQPSIALSAEPYLTAKLAIVFITLRSLKSTSSYSSPVSLSIVLIVYSAFIASQVALPSRCQLPAKAAS